MNLREFLPTLKFLGWFLGIYIGGNLVYGIYINSYGRHSDPVTVWVTEQCVAILSGAGWECEAYQQPTRPTTSIVYNGKSIVSVYEGCNGLNVIIIFLSFLLAFGPYVRAMWWFIGSGILIIHLANLARIILLFYVTLHFPGWLYFTHKYLFTAIIYAVVFLMWLLWVWRFAQKKNEQSQ